MKYCAVGRSVGTFQANTLIIPPGLMFTLSSIAPAFQWAQSFDSVFLNVKFAHKMDTPATLGVESEGVELLSSSFKFTGISKARFKRFVLELDLIHDILPDVSVFSVIYLFCFV